MTGEILYDSRYGQLTPEVAEKIRKSREEVKKLKGQNAQMPVCGFRLEEVYETSHRICPGEVPQMQIGRTAEPRLFQKIKKKHISCKSVYRGKVKKGVRL